MSNLHLSRRRELALLQLQLKEVGRVLDEIESRSKRRRAVLEIAAVDGFSNLVSESTEDRFAACVATGMSKIRS